MYLYALFLILQIESERQLVSMLPFATNASKMGQWGGVLGLGVSLLEAQEGLYFCLTSHGLSDRPNGPEDSA
ncbi:hypothetical protein VNO77_44091 [Canavalia gladiata]|uniref:Uncharacterized protein n=1 Tax=Canavalia gladiata TaxID=3824 RepID=A0AAN9PQN3_CANGL